MEQALLRRRKVLGLEEKMEKEKVVGQQPAPEPQDKFVEEAQTVLE